MQKKKKKKKKDVQIQHCEEKEPLYRNNQIYDTMQKQHYIENKHCAVEKYCSRNRQNKSLSSY